MNRLVWNMKRFPGRRQHHQSVGLSKQPICERCRRLDQMLAVVEKQHRLTSLERVSNRANRIGPLVQPELGTGCRRDILIALDSDEIDKPHAVAETIEAVGGDL